MRDYMMNNSCVYKHVLLILRKKNRLRNDKYIYLKIFKIVRIDEKKTMVLDLEDDEKIPP